MDFIKLYQKMGFSFFPLQKKSKKPLLNWLDYRDRKPTEEEIAQWQKDGLLDQVGIVCGPISDLMVFDVDNAEEFHQWLSQNGRPYAVNPTVITSKGKYHIYHQYADKDLFGDQKIPGVDIITRGYVVAPPSIHPLGTPYEWVHNS